MDQKKVDTVIRRTFDYLAEILDEEERGAAPKSESAEMGKDSPPGEREREKNEEVFDMQK